MPVNEFPTSKYFSPDDFDSPDLPGSYKNMKLSTLLKLYKAREYAGIPFIINSGFRTPKHNKKVGGLSTSSHLKGYAIDIVAVNSRQRFTIIKALLDAGFPRLGIYPTWIHADNDPDKPGPVIYLG